MLPSTESDGIAEAAQRLWNARRSNLPCAPVRTLLDAGDVGAAYEVQEVNTRRALSEGRRLVGRKIGLTSPAVQQQLGVDQPDFGVLFGDMAVGDAEEIDLTRLIDPRIEVEVAFVLETGLADAWTTTADVMRATAYVVTAIEVVDSRIAAWDIDIVDTVADNASSGLFFLGGTPRRLDGLDLRESGAVLLAGGEPLSVGAGAACLGHPVNAVTWLARRLATTDHPLAAGDVVLSGALGPMVRVAPGTVYEARVSGLGSVRAVCAKGNHS
ncbi:fumarylacetoacetate hydrolase family protein [Streptomyces sioyaensis]|uniref:2-keto-4-pentenoate hydratase n=1 Tax=Streptomyces sioyaensis TaxID=67364 RepID=A0A4Q1RC31_9ACTN|nr:fumarylacetoacetate hydrolase family protein [Streptomyces sioyaensis]MBM4795691.1 fumarylacetoacetate hydrolase family protein [Streptomyces sioyaensis]RXS71074.1 2-keto-4-pentenoate hydratase [Streptomyces sioyaensis]